jgi:hypothetical protein
MDFGDPTCDPGRGRLYTAEMTLGGLWEIDPDTERMWRHEVGGILPIPMLRFDGRLVIKTSAELLVFDPTVGRVLERTPAGLADFGFDLCGADGRAAVADMTGRLRVYQLDEDGYRFAWGVRMFAPRRVAFSPDCARIAVTSADDRRVFIVDTESRSIVDVHEAGPALREVAATGAREFSISDVCSITSYRW